jgi:nucleotide-binding universal stress UspA family protein
MFEHILIAVDGSEHDKKTLSGAVELTGITAGPIRVLHVREGDFIGRAGFVPREDHDEASDVVERSVAELLKAGATATGTVRSSLPNLVAIEILAEAEECGATVIIMGSRGVSDLKGLLVGSTAHKVLHLGRLPVLVIR